MIKYFRWFFLLLYCLHSHAVETEKVNLHALNTLTIRSFPFKQPQYKVTTIDPLVRYINKTNKVPYHVHLAINNNLYTVFQGVNITSSDTTVFIFSRGYAKTNTPGTNDNFLKRGACAMGAYLQLKDNIVSHGPIVSFDYDDKRTGMSFGQTNAINALQGVYNAVLAKNPQANIILIGDCRGAKVALEVASQRPKNLKALILMAPFISARELIHRIAQNYLPYPLRPILYPFLKNIHPQYDEKKDTLEYRLCTIPHDLPIFIAHRDTDTLVSTETIKKLEYILKSTGNQNIHVLILSDVTYPHSKLTGNSEVQKGINVFLKQYNLPYNELLTG